VERWINDRHPAKFSRFGWEIADHITPSAGKIAGLTRFPAAPCTWVVIAAHLTCSWPADLI
jgi:hypothetical protein